MPRLAGLGQRGIVFTAHHSVFPTVTRVNASSFVTGAYPEAHGLMGNTIYIPRASATQTLDTGKRENLEAGRARRRPAAHCAHAQRDASNRGQVPARREQRLERRDAAPEPHAGDRRDRPLRVHPASPAGSRGRPDPRIRSASRDAERWPQSVRRRRLHQDGARGSAPRCDVHVDQRSGWNRARERHGLRSDAAIADARRPRHRTHRGRAAGKGASGSHQHHRHVRPRILDPYRRAEAGRPRRAVRPAHARRVARHRRRRRRDPFPGGRRCCSSRGGRRRASETA